MTSSHEAEEIHVEALAAEKRRASGTHDPRPIVNDLLNIAEDTKIRLINAGRACGVLHMMNTAMDHWKDLCRLIKSMAPAVLPNSHESNTSEEEIRHSLAKALRKVMLGPAVAKKRLAFVALDGGNDSRRKMLARARHRRPEIHPHRPQHTRAAAPSRP